MWDLPPLERKKRVEEFGERIREIKPRREEESKRSEMIRELEIYVLAEVSGPAGFHTLHLGKTRSTSSTLEHAVLGLIRSRFIDRTPSKIHNIRGNAGPLVGQ